MPVATPRGTQALFAAAVQQHQAGRLLQAEYLYRQVLAARPRHADSLHLLGVLALQSGQADVAVELIQQAIAIDDRAALYHASLGNGLKALGQLDEAIVSYRRAIALNPLDPAPLNNLAVTLQAQQRLQEAEAFLRQASLLDPRGPETHNNLGNVLIDQGRVEEAETCYRTAMARWPTDPAAYCNLGAALKDQGKLEDAATSLQKALTLRPDLAAVHSNLGIVLHRLGRLQPAAESCRRAIAHQPDLLEAHDTLGSVLADQGQLAEAVSSYSRAMKIWPREPRLHSNLGTVLKAQGHLDDAITHFRNAISLCPDFASAHRNLGMALLARGDMTEGWREYEWRWEMPAVAASRRRFSQPQWRGEPSPGRTLLIHAEQGFGDTIQFCRYARLAAARGLRVVMQVQGPLLRLLRQVEGVERIIAQDEACPHFDLHCPMLSLPLACGTVLETVPPITLSADPVLTRRWGSRLDAMGRAGRRVGFAWAGNPMMVYDSVRSMRPDQLLPLTEVAGAHCISLQKAAPASGQQHGQQHASADGRDCRPAHGLPVTDWMAEIENFADTAALIANLDLVIAVDTAVAHLAASLGKPVWLMDRFDGDWRWLTGRTDSPWYPTLRLYRQTRPGEWETVLQDVMRDLRAWI